MIGLHCDLEGCDSWTRAHTDLPTGFLTVDDGATVAHLCCLDHVMRWAAAHSEPLEFS